MVSPHGRSGGLGEEGSDEEPYGRQVHLALRDLAPDEPLSDAFIASVERSASAQRQAAPRRRRWGKRFAKRWIAASTLLLAAAGMWRWSGDNSDDLDLLSALRVIESPQMHTEESLMSVVGKVDREVVGLLKSLGQQASWSAQFHERSLAAFDGDVARPRARFNAATVDLLQSHRGPMDAQAEFGTLDVLFACGSALRTATQISSRCALYAKIARRNIVEQLEQMREPQE